MRILKGIEIPIAICISYTVMSIVNAVLCLMAGRESTSNGNALTMLLWCSIAVFILSIHHLFEEWPPAVMMICQYLIAMGLVFLSVYIGSFFDELSEHGYRDMFLSFTIPYIIGGGIYYVTLFQTARRQDKLIQEINGKRRLAEKRKTR